MENVLQQARSMLYFFNMVSFKILKLNSLVSLI